MSFTNMHLYFEDIEVGQEWNSLGRTVTQTDIINFAGVSGDFNPVHIDHEFARSTIFQQPVAHGLLIFSMASGLAIFSPPMRTLAFMSIRDWQFREPVFIGDTIRVHTKVLEKQAKSRGKRGVVTWQRRLMNQHGKIVQEGVIVTLVEGRNSGKRTEDGGQRTEDGGQRTEDRGQKTEDRGQKTEDRRQRTEDGGRKAENREQRTEDRGQKSGTG